MTGIVSYAQNFEDVVLDRLFPRDHAGFYVDVGAYDPVQTSVTKHFSDLGWRGINIDPSPIAVERFRAERPRDVNLEVAVSSSRGTATYHEHAEHERGLSTLTATNARLSRERGHRVEERSVETTTLAAVFDEHVTGEIDFLSVDVEGHEGDVLAGADWSRWRPRVVVVEAVLPATFEPCHEEWEPALLDARYGFGLFDGLNRFYVRDEDASLLDRLTTAANATDLFVSQFHAQRYALRVGEVGGVELETLRGLASLASRFPRSARLAQRVVRGATRR